MLFLIQFCSNLFWMVQNDPNFVPNIFLCKKKSNTGCIFSFVCETSWRAGRTTMKFTPCMLHVIYKKKCKKHKNCLGSPSLWILHLKYENSCHLSLDPCWDIWRFWNWIFYQHSTRPQEFLFEAAKISGVISFPYEDSQLVPKYWSCPKSSKYGTGPTH